MNEKKDDRRIRKTKKALRESLAELMMEKSIKHITVRELTERADMNRATFYLHYKDVYDLQEHIEKDVIAEIEAILLDTLPPHDGNSPRVFFETLFQYASDNASQCRLLLGKNNSRSFIDTLNALVEQKCIRLWLSTINVPADDITLGYFCSYVVQGFIGIVVRWVEDGMQTSPEHMAVLADNIVRKGMLFFCKAKGSIEIYNCTRYC